MAHIWNMTKELYLAMPGAVTPPKDERGPLWGEVENTPEWLFCETIARLIISVDTRVRVDRD